MAEGQLVIADPHFALCSVRAENCSRHGQCARAQLAPRNVRQAYCTPNGRGDACRLFFDFQPLKRLLLTPAGSEAVQQEARPLTEAGGATIPAGLDILPALGVSKGK